MTHELYLLISLALLASVLACTALEPTATPSPTASLRPASLRPPPTPTPTPEQPPTWESSFEKAESLHKSGDFAAAVRLYVEALNESPMFPPRDSEAFRKIGAFPRDLINLQLAEAMLFAGMVEDVRYPAKDARSLFAMGQESYLPEIYNILLAWTWTIEGAATLEQETRAGMKPALAIQALGFAEDYDDIAETHFYNGLAFFQLSLPQRCRLEMTRFLDSVEENGVFIASQFLVPEARRRSSDELCKS